MPVAREFHTGIPEKDLNQTSFLMALPFAANADDVISDPLEVRPEWLTEVLNKKSGDNVVEVRSVDVVLTRELQVSTVHRLAIEYVELDQSKGFPRSIFLKLCKPVPLNHRNLYAAGSEIDFYTRAADAIGSPPLIRVYDSGFSPNSGHSHLLMEDLSETHFQPDQGKAPSFEMSRRAVEALAHVHAAWLNDRRIGNGVGEVFDRLWLEGFIADLDASVSEFISSVELTTEQRDAYRQMLRAAPRIWGRLTDAEGLTVTHGDAHWWNFLYPKDAENDSVRIFDWQLWHIDLGARDLAFLLAFGGFADPRPELESELLLAYLETIRANSLTEYSWDVLYQEYRWSAIRNLNLPVIFRAQGKNTSTWQTSLQKAFTAYKRLDCAELIC